MDSEQKPPKRRKINPKAFKPGQSGNPNGRPRLEATVKEVREITQKSLADGLNKYFGASEEEIDAALANPATTKIERIVLAIMRKAEEHGDHARFNALLERIIGKVPDRVESHVSIEIQKQVKEYECLNDAEAIALSERLRKQIEHEK